MFGCFQRVSPVVCSSVYAASTDFVRGFGRFYLRFRPSLLDAVLTEFVCVSTEFVCGFDRVCLRFDRVCLWLRPSLFAVSTEFVRVCLRFRPSLFVASAEFVCGFDRVCLWLRPGVCCHGLITCVLHSPRGASASVQLWTVSRVHRFVLSFSNFYFWGTLVLV
jgi:hypothetical protein